MSQLCRIYIAFVSLFSFSAIAPQPLGLRTKNMEDRFVRLLFKFNLFQIAFIFIFLVKSSYEDILGCGGFLKSQVPIDFSKVEIKLYTKQGTLKESSDCAPTNGYYFIPLYDKGEYSLKIEPPAGWYFEPKEVHLNFDGVNDPCSKSSDINFVFKGFTIHGKVISAGTTEGPENVVVNLSSDTNQEIKLTTTTNKSGYFQFTPIIPGKYTVSVKHDKYKFLRSVINISIKEENLEIPGNAFVIAGYDITGQVLFNGEPTKGVSFVLSAVDEKNHDIKPTDCSKAPLTNFKYKNYICHVMSDEKGIFQIKTVPPGTYKIRPYYVKFDVKPEELNVVVKHGHATLSDKFLVKGFTVGGQVLTSPEGSGISNALIYLNGEKVAVTDKEGKYNLDSMEPGSYVLSVQSDDLKFNEVNVKVSPNTPEIENIYPSEFRVCGKVTPSASEPPGAVEIQGGGKKIEAIIDPSTGQFCTFLKPGSYTLRVKISDLEKSTGMIYLPLTKEIHVRNGAVNDVEFTQLKGNISGRIVRLPEAGKAHEVSIKLKLKNSLVALKILEGNELEYNFQGVMPGYYDVELDSDRWCFQHLVHSISVTSSETRVPDFLQSGFKFKVVASHETSAVISNETPGKEFKKELILERGENVICLPHTGLYKLQALGCHGFEKDPYVIDAKDGKSLRLNAVSHDVTGFVRSSGLETDLVVEVAGSGDQIIKLGPLKGEKDGGGYTYNFKFRTKENQNLRFIPTSSQLLFQPETLEFRTVNDCSKDAIRFVGEKGLIVEGRIEPPLSDVKITLKTTNLNISLEDIVLITKANGKYKFGPLRKSWQFEITAEKESYIFSGPDKDGVFKAHKLAEIHVKVMDNSTKEPLQGVLLSLTGGEKYRKNSITGEGGLLTFHSLNPGEYFLRPVMKEYKFEPSSQIIHIKGASESIELRGRRVSFSAYGVVTSLNGEPESNVVIEAAGINTCSNLQEETSSETNGHFRIRGLLPQCEYLIRLKSGSDVNAHIHRLAPQDLVVRTNQGDVRDIGLIAFHLIEQMDITVHVESTIVEHLKTLKLKLCKDDSPDSPVHVIRLDTLAGGAKNWGNPATQERFLKAGLFVQFPFIPRDKTPYFIQLESTLNKHTYTYKEPVVHFIADKTYRNFKMTFEPVMKMLDHELSQSNYIVVPLLIFAALLYTYFHKLVPAVQNFFGSLNQNSFSFSTREERNFYSHNSMNDSVSIEPVSVTAVKRKMKPRKA